MPRSISTALLPRRQIATALVSGLLGLAALLATSPAGAATDSPTTCDPGEFCLGYQFNLSGGLYQNKGDDPNLSDNVFLPSRQHRVAKNSWSAYNHGTPQSNGKNDVIVYELPNYNEHGASACITLGRLLPDLFTRHENWMGRIMSFKWARHEDCVPHGVLEN
jgi:hypothetical protein